MIQARSLPQRQSCLNSRAPRHASRHDLLTHESYSNAEAVGEQTAPYDARGMLAQVALGPAASFAAFDALLAVAMGPADGAKGHGPLLAVGQAQDWAQGS